MYYIYMIRCLDQSIYTGITTDLSRRMIEHHEKRGAKYTMSHTMIALEAVWITHSRSLASKQEYAIKQLSRTKKEVLIKDLSMTVQDDVFRVKGIDLEDCLNNHIRVDIPPELRYNIKKESKGERQMTQSRIKQTFIDLVSIDSVSKHEGAVAEHLKKVFTDLGLEVKEDQSMEQTGLGSNNIVATLKGDPNLESLFFSCHTDTVTPGVGIEVIEKEGVLFSKGETILAADDKAGIAIMIETIQRIKEQGIKTGNLEFVLSPGEEIGLVGVSALDMSLVQSKMGYVLDMGGRIGNVTVGSPSMYMYEIKLHGKPAHAGLEPEKGISCVSILNDALNQLSFGRIDEETTANIGAIHGGEATNIVMDHMSIKGEVRSINDSNATRLVTQVEEVFSTSAKKFGGSIEFTKDKKAIGFKIENDQLIMKRLIKACESINLECKQEVSGGGSDANVFNASGKPTVNLSIGYDKIHTTEENIALKDMEQAVELVVAIVQTNS